MVKPEVNCWFLTWIVSNETEDKVIMHLLSAGNPRINQAEIIFSAYEIHKGKCMVI